MDSEHPVALFAGQPVFDRPVLSHQEREVADPLSQLGMHGGRTEEPGLDQLSAAPQIDRM